MQGKFSQTSQTGFLLPSMLTRQKLQMESFKQVFGIYGKYISCYDEEVLYEELLEFIAYTKSSQSSDDQQELDQPEEEEEEESTCTSLSPSILDALATAPKRFVNVRKLLRIAATLLLTSCTAERCFSAKKILKTRLRSKMDDDRLNGLALMYIHKETDISL